MLTLKLRKLERDGLLVRTVHPVVPPKVEYTLTEMAQELHQSLLELTDWAKRHGTRSPPPRPPTTANTTPDGTPVRGAPPMCDSADFDDYGT
jgi:DNA-binding HxlR family transcriptional regulator